MIGLISISHVKLTVVGVQPVAIAYLSTKKAEYYSINAIAMFYHYICVIHVLLIVYVNNYISDLCAVKYAF